MPKKKIVLLCGLCGISLVAAIYSARPWGFGRERTPIWNADLDLARQQARATGKPLLIEFNAEWCGPCQRMKTTTLHDLSVAQSLQKFVLVSIDIDAHPELASQLDVETIPQFFIVDFKSGRILQENRIGAMPPEDFLPWLNAGSDSSLNEVFPNFHDQALPASR